jgi:hypothetical protein
MKLKCIGGPNDGEYWSTVSEETQVGEWVQTFKPPENIEVNSPSQIITLDRSLYLVEMIRYHDKQEVISEWLFLRFSSLDRDQIMIDLLNDKFR